MALGQTVGRTILATTFLFCDGVADVETESIQCIYMSLESGQSMPSICINKLHHVVDLQQREMSLCLADLYITNGVFYELPAFNSLSSCDAISSTSCRFGSGLSRTIEAGRFATGKAQDGLESAGLTCATMG